MDPFGLIRAWQTSVSAPVAVSVRVVAVDVRNAPDGEWSCSPRPSQVVAWANAHSAMVPSSAATNAIR